MNGKPTLCLDFDGVIHAYTSGWQGPTVIADQVVPGFFEWARKARESFSLVIYSSRSKEPGGIEAMETWLECEYARIYGSGKADSENAIQDMLTWFTFAHEKPAAWLTIDDRAICFEGTWPDIETLRTFVPWNKRTPEAAAV
jgi:hypothetical protein